MIKSPTITAMKNAAIKAGKGLSRDFGELENLQVSRKGPGDFVTSADLRAEERIMEILAEFRPQYSFLVEESGYTENKDTSTCWIIDPLDGTTNFMHGLPHFCISIALQKTHPNGKKEIIAAVIFAPVLNEMFTAEKGQGAFINDRRMNVSGRTGITDSLFGSYPWHGRSQYCDNKAVAEEISGTTANVRILGSSALDLAYVASGKLDGFWHDSLKPWDMAAAILLLQESRGIVTDIKGGTDMLDTGTILAGNEHIHEKLSAIIDNHKAT